MSHKKEQHEELRLDRILERIAESLAGIDWSLQQIASELKPNLAVSAKLTFQIGGKAMPATAHVNDKPGSYAYQEFDGPNGSGNKVPPTGVVAFASDNPAVATIDATSGQMTYVGAGTANISASDGGNFPATDVFTLIASVAASSTLTFTPGS